MPLDLKVIKETVEGLVKPLGDAIDSLHTSREEKDRLKVALATMQEQTGIEFNKLQASVIIAETQGQSPLQRNWRPGLMVLFGYIIAHNYVIAPIGTWIAALLGSTAALPVLDLPTGLWTTLNVGIGGYMSLRTVEKVRLGKERKPK